VPAQNSRTTLPEPSIRPALWVAGAAVIALLLKLAIAFNTMGTNDVVRFYQFARVLSEQGLEETYRHLDAFNHPPLVACFLTAIYRLARIPLFETTGLSFAFLLRLPGIIADFIVVFLFLWLRKQGPQLKLPLWALLLFALSPVSIMVSGFHGNTDPVMVLFLVLATIAALRQRPIWCGILLALSCQIKIIPVLLIPAFFFFWNERRRLLCFLPPLVLTTAILWSQPLLQFPLVFFRNVFGYGSFWGIWGITYCLQKTGWSEFSQVDFQNLSPAQNVIGCLLKVLIVAAIVVLTWRRRQIVSARGFLTTLAFTWLIFFVLSPGIGAQYLVWLAPFILLVSPTFYAACVVGSSLFLFFFYNTISGGFPWYYGLSNGTRDAEWLPWSLWPWIILCVGMVLLWRKTAAEEALKARKRYAERSGRGALRRKSAVESIVSRSK
jgi:Gpi18-like mannosyltransferase